MRWPSPLRRKASSGRRQRHSSASVVTQHYASLFARRTSRDGHPIPFNSSCGGRPTTTGPEPSPWPAHPQPVSSRSESVIEQLIEDDLFHISWEVAGSQPAECCRVEAVPYMISGTGGTHASKG